MTVLFGMDNPQKQEKRHRLQLAGKRRGCVSRLRTDRPRIEAKVNHLYGLVGPYGQVLPDDGGGIV